MKATSKGAGSHTIAIPGKSPHAVGRLGVGKYQGHRALITDGVIFSVAVSDNDPPFGYWAAMLPSGKPRTALLLGLGGGTLAHLLHRRFPDIRITGIDNDPDLLTFARKHFHLDLPNLKVVVTNAFDYVTRCRRRFEFVAVDLFVGSAFERGVLSSDFLRRLDAIRSNDGEIAINLYRDKCSSAYLARIRRILPVSRVDRLPCNVIAHCCPAPVLPRLE